MDARAVRLRMAIVAGCGWLAAYVGSCAADGTITVHEGREGPEVSPHMYGVFFEELGHAGDGGLYAELVRNRSFEDANVPEGMTVSNGFAVARCRDRIPWPPKEPVPGWTVVTRGDAAAAMTTDTNRPLNAAQVHALRLDIQRATPAAPAGVANGGYWGLSLRQGIACRLTLHARADNFRGTLRAGLEARDGRPLCAPAALEGVGPDWKRLAATLTPAATDHEGRLVLLADAPGTVWLDVVSLFPADTWAGRPHGLRADLVRMLKDLKPGFLRFPGGCVTEGLTLEQGFAWKKTLGDIAERPGVWNAMWGYRRTDGLGYHELLQLAEDIGAAALYCNNMGIACTIHTAGGVPCAPADVPGYVEDTVDAVAYARDPPGTPWGDRRARNGHPAPFDLRYVNIGNELNSREYTERYPRFYQALKAKYPDVTTIAYAPVGNPKAPVEIKDLHDYRDEAWFLANLNRFDSYSRTGPKAANMELAVRNRTPHTLRNALLESAYMLGLERNADVMRLVSYAPLLLNVNHPNPWLPVLIHFDNHRVFGTPSYYAQMLFMHHRPDVVLGTTVETSVPGLYALAGKDRARGEIVLKIVNLGAEARVIGLRLDPAGPFPAEASETVLTSADDADRNSLDEPRKVLPVTRTIRLAPATPEYRVPARALAVLRWRPP